jgi:hypothetical protein
MADTAEAPPKSGGGGGGGGKAAAQIAKLKDANNKYKNLLKMAKERIQKQETETGKLRQEMQTVREEVDVERAKNASLAQQQQASMNGHDGGGSSTRRGTEDVENDNSMLVGVSQRIKVDIDSDDGSDVEDDDVGEGRFDIWALLEMETTPPDDDQQPRHTVNNGDAPKRWKVWKRFPNETALSDFIMRDTGEPIILPPYSLSPDQSQKVETEARQAVGHITEEFRRYRVRSEVLRKQSDATLRAMQGAYVTKTQQRIEGQDLAKDLAQTKAEHAQLVQLRKELKQQDTQWKDAYDTLLEENKALKGSGAEALLASQWRHRYEQSEKEKGSLGNKLETMEKQVKDGVAASANSKYEAKYRDMKESFRLYRKKAKEIFEAQQRGDGAAATGMMLTMGNDSSSGRSGEEAKLSYLKNLMVNYFSSNETMKESMEIAIRTVLKFSEEDVKKVEQAKKSNDGWLF